MIIKKFEAETETEAMLLAKQELGKDAVVMNIKTIKPKGIMRFFKKTTVEVTAAADDPKNTSENKKEDSSFQEKKNYINGDMPTLADAVKKTMASEFAASAIEEKLNNLQNMIEKQMELNKETPEKEKEEENSGANKCIELVKKHLLHNEVEEKYANQILDEVRVTISPDAPVDSILTNIYQKIVLKLGQPELIKVDKDNPKYIFFMGPTGVGKTTSIAKIASDIKLNQKLNVALVTSDTYRIAAVEQLRTYANILEIPVKVVYTASELKNIKEELDQFDVVLIDTAGRSHKDKKQKEELKALINTIDEKDRSLFLVLSATTKYSDLVHIVNAYANFDEYRLIFTKLDETSTCGSILNIKLLTGATLSYATWGQDVPSDIGQIDAQTIAKQLLGGSN